MAEPIEKILPAIDRNELSELFEPLSGNAKNVPPADPGRKLGRLTILSNKASSPQRDRDTLE